MKRTNPKATTKKVSAKILSYISATKFNTSEADTSTLHRIFKKPLPDWEYNFNQLPNNKEKRTDLEKAMIEDVVFWEYGREDWRNYQPHCRNPNAVPYYKMGFTHTSAPAKQEIFIKPFSEAIIMKGLDGNDGGFEYMQRGFDEKNAQLSGPPSFSIHAVMIDWTNTKEKIIASFEEWMNQQPGSRFPRLGKSYHSMLNAQLDCLVAWRASQAGYTHDEFKKLTPRTIYTDKYVFNQACKKANKIISAIAQGAQLHNLLGVAEKS